MLALALIALIVFCCHKKRREEKYEKEVQTTQFRMEAKQEVAEIVNPRKEDFKSSVIDLEFEDAVREYKNR